MDQSLLLLQKEPLQCPKVFHSPSIKYLLRVMLSAREGWVSEKRCYNKERSLASLLGLSTKWKWGLVRKPSLGWREENQRKFSIDTAAWLGSCPWAKINSPWQWDKMLILAPARGSQPKSQLRWSNEPGDLRGLRPQWLLAARASLQAVYWNRGFPTPLGWVSEQSEVQVAHPAEQPTRAVSMGAAAHQRAPGATKGCLERMQQMRPS